MRLESDKRRTPRVFRFVNDTWGSFQELEFAQGIDEVIRRTAAIPRDVLLDVTRMGFLPLVALRPLFRLVEHVREGSRPGRLVFVGLPDDLGAVIQSNAKDERIRTFLRFEPALAFFGVRVRAAVPPGPREPRAPRRR